MNTNNSFDASGSLAGYLFQCRLALLRGLELSIKSPSSVIFIEKFDDISFETDDYRNCLIQAKHHILEKSLSDKSIDVWKTFRIWIETLKNGVFETSNTSLFLITTAIAPDDGAMALLRENTNADDKERAFVKLKKAAEESDNKETKNARELFLALNDDEAQLLLSRITLIDNHPNLTNVLSDISDQLRIVAPTKSDIAAEYLEGWWLNQIGRHLIEHQNHGIPCQHIALKAHEIGKTLSDDMLPIDDPQNLNIKQYTREDEARNFVRQMRSINLDDRYVKNATSDFYRAYAQRSKWSRENLILEDELSNYDEKLQDSWQRKFDAEVLLASSENENEKIKTGLAIFLWAIQESTPLRNVVEKWITAGSFHNLSDQMKVGWHPDFKTVVQKVREMEDA